MAFHDLCFAACGQFGADSQLDTDGAKPDETCIVMIAKFHHQALHNHLSHIVNQNDITDGYASVERQISAIA